MWPFKKRKLLYWDTTVRLHVDNSSYLDWHLILFDELYKPIEVIRNTLEEGTTICAKLREPDSTLYERLTDGTWHPVEHVRVELISSIRREEKL